MAKIVNPYIVIANGGGGTTSPYTIIVYDVPNTQVAVIKPDGKTVYKTVPEIGGAVSFEFSSPGSYDVSGECYRDDGTEFVWLSHVDINSPGEYIVKRALKDYPIYLMHTALQGGYFSKMFDLGEKVDFVGNTRDGVYFLERISKTEDNKEIADFRAIKSRYNSIYKMYDQIKFLTSTADTRFTTDDSSIGGYKYSDLRTRMMGEGEEIYTHASCVLPDSSSLTGIKFSDLKYFDNTKAYLYAYNRTTDTFTQLTGFETSSIEAPLFFKGMMWKEAGYIDEAEFNAHWYYKKDSTNTYYRDGTYDSKAIYYSLHPTTVKESDTVNGLAGYYFKDSLKSYIPYYAAFSDYFERFDNKSGVGGTDSTNLSATNDYMNILAVEEITGTNKNTELIFGGLGTNIFSYNPPGEGTKSPFYDSFEKQARGFSYWTRSPWTTSSKFFSIVSVGGILNGLAGSLGSLIFLGFRLK